MNSHCRGSILILLFLLPQSAATRADTINFVNNCAGQIPTNAADTWFGSCPDPVYNETNWEGNLIPGPSDQAVIGVEYGMILVNGPGEAASVDAQGGLELDASSYSLTLSSGDSFINPLHLTASADIRALAGATVNLLGSSLLRADAYGPGTFESTGSLSLNYGRLWEGATLISHGAATLTTGYFLLGHGNTSFFNNGTFTISGTASEVGGGGSQFQNDGSLTFNWTGSTSFYFHPNYAQQGNLIVEAGTLRLNGITTDFQGGSVTVNAGAVLEHASSLGGEQDHRYSGEVTLSGGGWIHNEQEVTVSAPLTIGLGTGTASSGSGGYRHSGFMALNATVTNTGRFRFYGGTIDGDRLFTNAESGWSYTGPTGVALIDATFNNLGNFQLGGAGLGLDGVILNWGKIRVLGGPISGDGQITIYAGSFFELALTDPNAICYVGPTLHFAANGTIHACAGHLQFDDDPSLGGTLYGRWMADPGTTIRFPKPLTTAGAGAMVIGDLSRFWNLDLQEIRPTASVVTESWSTVADLLNGGTLEVEAGGDGVTVNGALTNANGGQVGVEAGAQLQADQIDNGETGDESVVPELCGIAVLAKAPSDPALVVTPLLNNRARILPGGERQVGTIQLSGNLVQHPTGGLVIDLGGPTPGAEHDQLTIQGGATLDGVVEVNLVDSYWPTVGQECTILTATGTLDGTFAAVESPMGALFSLRHEADRVVLVTEASDPTSVPEPGTEFHLADDVPNPFNPATTLGFALPRALPVGLRVFDLSGRLVRVLKDGEVCSPGHNEVVWDGRDDAGRPVASGTYCYRLDAAEFTATKRMVLVR